MTINHAFYQNPLNTNHKPDYEYVILDTSKVLNKLQSRIRTKFLEEIFIEEDRIIELVFQSLAYKHKAKQELEYNCLDIAGQYYGTCYSGDFIIMAEAIAEFGKELLAELIRLNIYNNGYLFYQFMNKIGHDIVLGKLVPPDISKCPNFPTPPDE